MLSYRFNQQVSKLSRISQHFQRNCLKLLLISFVLVANGGMCDLYSEQTQKVVTRVDIASTSQPQRVKRAVSFAHPSLTFEPNRGQDHSNAHFISYGQRYVLRLEPDEASLTFLKQSRGNHLPNSDAFTLGLKFLGSNLHAAMIPEEKAQGEHSYFPSGDPKSWITSVPNYNRVNYKGVYPGVDVSFYGHAGQLEYDFIVEPESDAGSIRLGTTGADELRIDKAGSLVLNSHGEAITLLKPVAYQLSLNGTERKPVEVGYQISRAGTSRTSTPVVSFSLGEYDHQRPLVIDPVMVYGLDIPGTPGSTYPPYYFADTQIAAMTADAAGNTYVAASVGSSYASTNVLKFDPNGNLLLDVSLGSQTLYINPHAIAVDAAGDVYLAGQADPGLPATAGAFQSTVSGTNGSGFFTVIKSDGSSLVYSSYLGAADGVTVTGLAVDSKGMAYLTGNTPSSNFPTTAGVYEPEYPNSEIEQPAGFVSKFNPSLSGAASLVYSTYLSGYDSSFGDAVAVDGSGDAYVAVYSYAGFPVTEGAYNFEGEVNSGGFVTKLNPTGTAVVYSAFLGPGSPNAIAVDGSGEVYVAGTVESSNFPVTTGAYQTSYPGGFAAKLNSAGSALVYSTYLSGPSGYQANSLYAGSLAIPPGCQTSCEAYISGQTAAQDFPVINPIQSFPGAFATPPAYPGIIFETGFLVGLAANGESAIYSTYLGAASSTTANQNGIPAIALDSAGNVYFASNVNGADAPVTIPSVAYPGEGFLAKISPTNVGATVAVPTQVVFSGEQPVNSKSTGIAVQLRNVGSEAVTLSRPFSFSSTDFSETDNCPASIPGGGICTVVVTFTPAASGQRSATLTMGSSAQNSPAIVSLSGIALNAPDLELSATSFAFGDQVILSSSSAQVLTLTNTGDLPQILNSISNSTADFKVNSNCPAQLAAGASCQVSVVFSPTQIGLRTDYLIIQETGSGPYLVLQGVGVLASAGDGTLAFSPTTLNFGSLVVGNGNQQQYVALMNTGNTPVTINSVSVSTTAGNGNAGDFSLVTPASTYYSDEYCGYQYQYSTESYAFYTFPFQLPPQGSCTIEIGFAPSISGQEAGTLTVQDSAVASPHALGLSGIGLISSQPLTISPSTMTFPAQPVGDPSAVQTFTITNPGQDFVAIDRTFTTGDFGIAYGGNCNGIKLGPQGGCEVSVYFSPTTTGARTGTLTLTDALSSSPSVFNLSGTGIQATGALVLGQSSIAFGTQDEGTTSPSAELFISNPGNSPLTINNIEATGDFAVTSVYEGYGSYCGQTLAAGTTCEITVAFTPTHPSGAETGSLLIHSSLGITTVSLSGTSVESAQAIEITPSTISFGGAIPAATTTATDTVAVFINNTGGAPVTFPSVPTIAGVAPSPGTDFQISSSNCGAYLPFYANTTTVPMPPGANCTLTLVFTPTLVATEQATLSLVDSAGTQTIAMSGVGAAAVPKVTLEPPALSYTPLAVGATSTNTYFASEVDLYNNGQQPLTIASATVTAGSSDFSVNTTFQSCSGESVFPGSYCDTVFYFHPSATGYRTGTVTFKDSQGNSYTAGLSGYGETPVYQATLTPQAFVFPDTILQSTYSPNSYPNPGIVLTNTGNVPLIIGSVSGTNLSSTGDFAQGYDLCSGQTVQPGSTCTESPSFTPRALGTRTGTLTFPVTYANQTTATFTASLSGVGIAAVSSATLTPQSSVFPATVAGTSQLNYGDTELILVLTNTGNSSLTVGTMSGTDVTATAGTGGDFVEAYGTCSGQVVGAGLTCNTAVFFAPLTTGLKSTTITVPVTYAGGATATFTATLSGQGVAAAPVLAVSPSGLAFEPEVVGTSDSNYAQNVSLSSTGNSSVKLTSITASSNFILTANQCGTPLNNGSSCNVTVGFAPLAATTPGAVSGTLTIVDNAPGSPHVVKLSGTAVSVAQELSLSQTTVSFASQMVGTVSNPQAVYLTDLGSSSSRIQIQSISLGGTNASDFTETQTCGGSLGFAITGRASCTISVAFTPKLSSVGARTATVKITPAQGSPLTITLNGTGLALPITLSETNLSFGSAILGTSSGSQTVIATNTGTAVLSISSIAVTGTDASSWMFGNNCGTSLAVGASCTIHGHFAPTVTGALTAAIILTDSAGTSPQTITLSGTGVSPVTLSATSLSFPATKVGTSSTSLSVTMTNIGSVALSITSITVTGTDVSSFVFANSCGTSLAAGASCTIHGHFAPTTTGAFIAAIKISDSSADSPQAIALSGTGQ